jgi:hypothetical protein
VGGLGLVAGWWVVGILRIVGLAAAIVVGVVRVLGVVPVVGRSGLGLVAARMEQVGAQLVLVVVGRRPVGFEVGLVVVGSSSLRLGGFRCIVHLGRAIVRRFRIQLGRRCRSTGLLKRWGGIAVLEWGRLVVVELEPVVLVGLER